LVNIDFFKDLLKVLKDLIALESDQFEDSDNEAAQPTSGGLDGVHHRLLCIVAAFELLSGQGKIFLSPAYRLFDGARRLTGEALNIDLSDFISHLYALILSLSLVPNIDSKVDISPSTEELLFRALNIIFSPRTSGAAAPSWRSAAFAKRLLTAAVHWPPSTALRAIEFVAGLVAKDSKLAALLSSEDRIFNGVYHPEIDDPQLCNAFGSSFWELHALHENYWDARVREEARKLLSITL
jgi:nucleolar complex protein 3